MTPTPKIWNIFHLRNYSLDRKPFNFANHNIVYSAKDSVKLFIKDLVVELEPEYFYFISPGTEFHFDQKYTTAFVLDFQVGLFVDRIELLYQIKNGTLFEDPKGKSLKNDFYPYELILENFYLPVRQLGIPQIMRRNMLLNLLEYLLIRILLSSKEEIDRYQSTSYEKKIVERFLFLLREETDINFSASYYADKLNITKRTLDHAVKEKFGCTAKKYIVTKAIERSKRLLLTTNEPIKVIAMEIGFSQESNFNNFFKKHTGLTPGQFRDDLDKKSIELDFMKQNGRIKNEHYVKSNSQS